MYFDYDPVLYNVLSKLNIEPNLDELKRYIAPVYENKLLILANLGKIYNYKNVFVNQ